MQQWPKTTVNSIKLIAEQGCGDNKARRNWFYEQFGLIFDYTDSECREGRSRPMLTEALIQVETWKKNITEHKMQDYLGSILDLNERVSSDLDARDRTCASLITERKLAEARPFRWALGQLYFRYSQPIIVVFVLTAIIGLGWVKAS